MQHAFLVFGYGVPRDIFKDGNYNFYLKTVFNHIYDRVTEGDIQKPVIICSGGKTDCRKPYQRTEAEEMVKFLKLLARRSFLKKLTKDWIFVPEKRPLSTLENFLFCAEFLRKKSRKADISLFCEKTREGRIKLLAKKIFPKGRIHGIPIDFDVSPNRYLDPAFLQKKERTEVRHSLWALQSSENLKKHHRAFEEKFEFLRQAGSGQHAQAVGQWWEEKLKEIEK